MAKFENDWERVKSDPKFHDIVDRILATHDPITLSKLWKELERQADEEEDKLQDAFIEEDERGGY